jgi:hypothetical protein
VNARIDDQGFRVNLAVSFINESGGFYLFWKKVSAGCAWDAWRGCYLVVWDGIEEDGDANDGEERRCIDELLRKNDGRKVKEEACVGSQEKEIKGRFYGGEQAEKGVEGSTMG